MQELTPSGKEPSQASLRSRRQEFGMWLDMVQQRGEAIGQTSCPGLLEGLSTQRSFPRGPAVPWADANKPHCHRPGHLGQSGSPCWGAAQGHSWWATEMSKPTSVSCKMRKTGSAL